MKATDNWQRHSLRSRAFSLIEVVIAISIISFAIVAIFGVVGSVTGQFADVRTKRAFSGAIGCLSEYFNNPQNLNSVLDWAQGSGTTVFIASYRADSDGAPSLDGKSMRIECRPADGWTADSNFSAFEAARQGPWVGASIRLDTNLTTAATIPATLSKFTNGCLVFQARLSRSPGPTAEAATGGASAAVVSIVINR